ncbi:uncharacterized protein LACBIDRAFT_325125 [Laccaria bicolor S238N-H82]|uniref:Predicted protein n=1 Tax=Laccaria bicolor (strain S238N-H82 / ATCC MYA-4686) TaxID=486041 RepID=B0D588_LACBS|nr:uncharacterized protein LACBIDRAFT_325125 [Laccaria bicolor S238N-H82]EDR10473.1 predicted protein [Laccaria bicolor S238N-H82]|eukprot:XP_001878923.1 predicted protein [Laccaria bicolor S238N-H82]
MIFVPQGATFGVPGEFEKHGGKKKVSYAKTVRRLWLHVLEAGIRCQIRVSRTHLRQVKIQTWAPNSSAFLHFQKSRPVPHKSNPSANSLQPRKNNGKVFYKYDTPYKLLHNKYVRATQSVFNARLRRVGFNCTVVDIGRDGHPDKGYKFIGNVGFGDSDDGLEIVPGSTDAMDSVATAARNLKRASEEHGQSLRFTHTTEPLLVTLAVASGMMETLF